MGIRDGTSVLKGSESTELHVVYFLRQVFLSLVLLGMCRVLILIFTPFTASKHWFSSIYTTPNVDVERFLYFDTTLLIHAFPKWYTMCPCLEAKRWWLSPFTHTEPFIPSCCYVSESQEMMNLLKNRCVCERERERERERVNELDICHLAPYFVLSLWIILWESIFIRHLGELFFSKLTLLFPNTCANENQKA